jgi:hypothetical protein
MYEIPVRFELDPALTDRLDGLAQAREHLILAGMLMGSDQEVLALPQCAQLQGNGNVKLLRRNKHTAPGTLKHIQHFRNTALH